VLLLVTAYICIECWLFPQRAQYMWPWLKRKFWETLDTVFSFFDERTRRVIAEGTKAINQFWDENLKPFVQPLLDAAKNLSGALGLDFDPIMSGLINIVVVLVGLRMMRLI